MDPFVGEPRLGSRALSASNDVQLVSKVVTSIRHIKKALTTWPLLDVGVAFNGGKDSIVLLALVQYVLSYLSADESDRGGADDLSSVCYIAEESFVGSESFWSGLTLSTAHRGSSDSIRTVFFLDQNNFPEVLEFMWEVAMKNKLDVVIIRRHIKAGLRYLNAGGCRGGYVSHLARPLRAVFMGTRRSDPGGASLSTFSRTDEGWSNMMRVNPLLEWDYHDIWDFTRRAGLPHCSLYSRGYTSIGSVETTRPNRYLWNEETRCYLPAWLLSSGAFERSGRTEKPA